MHWGQRFVNWVASRVQLVLVWLQWAWEICWQRSWTLLRSANDVVVVFGPPSVGKTSLVNALTGSGFRVGASIRRVGLSWQIAGGTHGARRYCFVDTSGLHAQIGGRVGEAQARRRAEDLLNEVAGRVRLVIMVVKRGRIEEPDLESYRSFRNAIDEERVPIIIAVTHCENEVRFKRWSDRNKGRHVRQGLQAMKFVPVAFQSDMPGGCQATRAKLARMRTESVARLWRAIDKYSLRPHLRGRGQVRARRPTGHLIGFVRLLGRITPHLVEITRILIEDLRRKV